MDKKSIDLKSEIKMLEDILFNINIVNSDMSNLTIENQCRMLTISDYLSSTIKNLKEIELATQISNKSQNNQPQSE